MPRRSHEARWERKCARGTDPHAAAEVEAIWRACYGIAKIVGARMGVSASRVQNMMCGEQPSPLTQLRRLVDTAVDEGQDLSAALAPVHYLVDRYLVEHPEINGHADLSLAHSSSLALERACEAVQAAIAAVTNDDAVTDEELNSFRDTLENALVAFEVLERVVENNHRLVAVAGQKQRGPA